MEIRKPFFLVGWAIVTILVGAGVWFQLLAATEVPKEKSSREKSSYFKEEFKSGTYITGSSVVVAIAPDQSTLSAYSTEVGGWSRFEAPEGTRLMPIIGRDVAAPALIAPEIKEVAAFSSLQGSWTRHELDTPTKVRVDPIVSTQIVCYQIGDRIYAFSGVTGTWDTIESKGMVSVSEKTATVRAGSRLSIFGVQTGRWESIDMKAM